MKVILNDKHNTLFEGNTPADIITQMKLDDWTIHSSSQGYQENMGRRIERFCGNQINYTSDLEFLQELQRINFIRLMII